RFAFERGVPKFRKAFSAYGLPAGQGDPAVAAQQIRQRPVAVREAILAALDEWVSLAGSPQFGIDEPHQAWLRAVLDASEPEAWVGKGGAAGGGSDRERCQAALEALARSADVQKVPAHALTCLSRRLRPPQAVELLRRAQAQYPDDFWINTELGLKLQE